MDVLDERSDRADVVTTGELPPIEPPVTPRRFKAPTPADDALRGWIVTLTLTVVGGIIRFWNLGMATDSGTGIFDEKYYTLNAAEMLRLGGIEENAGYFSWLWPMLNGTPMTLARLHAQTWIPSWG